MSNYDFGMIGLGTMGRNLLLNVADHGFAAIGYDKNTEQGKLLESSASPGTNVKSAGSLQAMLDDLKTPRKIMLLVPAGPIVDAVLNELTPLVSEGDIIIDGGNSHFSDTLRRNKELQGKNIHFMGMGVSGGEEGARRGPSIMPGGDEKAWKEIKPILESVAAKVNNEPCVAYMGKDAAGHYVKMVHNGIEYAIMQLISEVYDFMNRSIHLSNDEMHKIFSKWNEGELQSYLIEITAAIFPVKDKETNGRLLNVILDKAGSKGTGKWTSQEAMNIPVSIPTIDMAVAMRDISGYKAEREKAGAIYKPRIKDYSKTKDKVIAQLEDALYLATLISYAQGLSMLQKASEEYKMDIPLKDVVKIWRGGCIIRSAQLELFYDVFKKKSAPPNILLDRKIASIVKKKQNALRKTIQQMTAAKIPSAALSASLAYLDAYASARMPVNMIQAQRDFFGAHTYERIDKEGKFHTEWEENTEK